MNDLITERLVLHPLSVEEAARIATGTAGPRDRWADGFPTGDDRDAVHMYVKSALSAAAPGTVAVPVIGRASAVATTPAVVPSPFVPFVPYRIDCRRDGAAFGTIGFYGPPDATGHVTIGYGLVAHSWGNGYATEAVGAFVKLCRERSDVHVIEADTRYDNLASQRVLEKNNFHEVRRDEDLVYYRLVVS